MTPEEYQAWVNQGQAWVDSALSRPPEQAHQAEWDFEQAHLCFGNAQDLHWQAYLYHQQFQASTAQGQKDRAFGLAHRSLKAYQAAFDPKGRCLMLIHYAQFLSHLGRRHQALSLFRAAVVLAQDQAPSRLGLAFGCLGEEYLLQGCYLEAIQSFDQALEGQRLDPSMLPWCFKRLAEAFAGVYRLSHADRLYRKALKQALDEGQAELAAQCRRALLDLESRLNTGFSFSDLGLRSRHLA